MKKRVLSFFLAVALVFSLVVIPTSAKGNVEVRLNTVGYSTADAMTEYVTETEELEKASIGDFVAAKIIVANNTDNEIWFSGYHITLNYDATAFETVTYPWELSVNGSVIMSGTAGPFAKASKGAGGINWQPEVNTKNAGVADMAATSREYVNIPAGGTATIGYLLLKVKAEIETGEYAITFAEGEQENYVNSASGKDESVDAKISDAIFVPASLTINGVAPTLKEVTLSSTPVQVDGTTGATVNATATSTSNKDITGLVTWSISGDENSGVSINAATGVITVDAKAKAGLYTVTATAKTGESQGESKTATLRVTRAPSIYTIQFEQNEKQTSIPASGMGTVNFKASGVDQYGQTTSSFSWSIEPAGKGVTVSGGVVTVTAEAAQYIADRQEFTVTASADVGSSGTAKLVVYRDTAPASIVISGGPEGSTLAVPTTDAPNATATYTATVYDQYGDVITNPDTIEWKLRNESVGDTFSQKGVTIDQNGALTITKEAAGNPFPDGIKRNLYIEAICGEKKDRMEVHLTREKARATRIAMEDIIIAVPKSGEANVTRSYLEVYDQYDIKMGSPTFEKTTTPNTLNGVTFTDDKITVTSAAAGNTFINGECQFTLTITCNSASTDIVSATKTITLKRELPKATAIGYSDGGSNNRKAVPYEAGVKVPASVEITVYDQYGQIMNGAEVQSNGALPAGIVLENGKLYITKAAKTHFGGKRQEDVTVRVSLKSGNAEGEVPVHLKLEAAQINKDSAEITGSESIAKPTGEQTNTAEYSIGAIVDQYGLPMQNVDRSKLSLKLYHDKECGSEADGSRDHVQLSGPDQSGQWTITVTSGAEVNTKYYLKAKYSDMQCAPVKEITIVDKTVSNTLTVTQGDFTYGEEGKLNPVVKKGSEPITNATFVYTKGGQTVTEIKDAGTYTVTATCEDATHIYTGSKDFQILPKKIEVGWIELDGTRYTYNGREQTVQYTIKDGETTLVKDRDYTVKDNSDSGTDAGVYRLEITGKGNYTSDPTGAPSVNWNIWELPVKISAASFQSRAYDKDNYSAVLDTLMLVADEDGVTMPDTLTAGNGFTVSDIRVANNNVGRQPVSFKVTLNNTNYKWAVPETGNIFNVSESAGYNVTINKIDHQAETAAAAGKYGSTVRVPLAEYLPDGWSVQQSAISVDSNGNGNVHKSFRLDGTTLVVELNNNEALVGKYVKITLPVASTNYNPFTITVNITVREKAQQVITASNLNVTYGDAGVKVNASALDNAQLTYQVTEGADVVTVDADGNVTLLKSGTATVKITAAETENYGTANTTVTVTVAKRSLTVKADDLTAYVGGQLPALDYTVTGLVSGEMLTTVPELELKDVPAGVDPMKTAGTYTIGFKTAPAADADKYDLTTKTGTLTVSSRPNVNPVPAGNSVKLEEAAGGKITSSVSRATKGTTVTITVKPDAGYQLEELEVLDKNGEALPLKELANGKFSFQMPDSKVTVQATFARESTYAGYPDVLPQDWFYSSVRYVTERGLMNGTPNGFEPNMDSSRATIWTILARFSGVDTTVVSGEWYAVARQWAMENGVSDGTNPNGVITREQLATMLYRFAKNKGLVQEPVTADLSVFVDAGQISDYALDAMRWAVSVGLLNGMDGSRLAPQGSAARAQVAAMLMRFDQLAK